MFRGHCQLEYAGIRGEETGGVAIATCNYIVEHNQNESAMKAVIDYVSQDSKTLDTDGLRYLAGVNCVGGDCV